MQVVPEFVHEEWLDDLVVEEDALRDSLVALSLLRYISYWELTAEDGVHLVVLVLESAHDVLASYYQVHHTGYQDAGVKAFGFETYC